MDFLPASMAGRSRRIMVFYSKKHLVYGFHNYWVMGMGNSCGLDLFQNLKITSKGCVFQRWWVSGPISLGI